MAVAVPRVRVLIVDDSEAVVTVLQMMLAGKVEIVGTARTGCDAIELSRQLLPDVVLLDLGLPDASGLEVLKKLKEERAEVRVLVLSGGFDGAEQARDLGAEDFLLKGSESRDSLCRKVISPSLPGSTG